MAGECDSVAGECESGRSESAMSNEVNAGSSSESLEAGFETKKKHAYRRKSIAAPSAFKRQVALTAMRQFTFMPVPMPHAFFNPYKI